MAGEVERAREPAAGRYIELRSAAVRERRDGLHGALEGPGVHRPPVPDAAEVRQVVRHRAQPRRRARRRERRAGPAPGDEHGGALPQEDEREPGDPHGGEQGLVGREEGGRAPPLAVEVEPPPPARRLHHQAGGSRVCRFGFAPPGPERRDLPI